MKGNSWLEFDQSVKGRKNEVGIQSMQASENIRTDGKAWPKRNTNRQVHINMLEIKQNGKKDTTGKFVALVKGQWICIHIPGHILTLRANKTDQRRMPYMKPLYWKCMWSTMRNPGWRKMDAEMILWMDGSTEPFMNLNFQCHYKRRSRRALDALEKSSAQDQFS